MAIPCEVCGKKVSKRSTSCPNCGHPTPASVVAYKEAQELERIRAEEERKRREEARRLAAIRAGEERKRREEVAKPDPKPTPPYEAEEIALQAELDQTNNELSSMVKALRQIDSISKSNPTTMALLEVEKIANYKTIPELVRMSAYLETMLANEDLDSFLKKEFSRNLHSTNQKIDREIKNAIEWINSVAKETLDRKKGLERKLVELRANEENAILTPPVLHIPD